MGSIEALPIAEEVLSSLVPTDSKPTAVKEPKKSYYKKKNDMVWTDAEDKQLLQCVIVYGADAWSRICKTMGKSMIQCHKRYLALTNQTLLTVSHWTAAEDKVLLDFVTEHGSKNWTIVA